MLFQLLLVLQMTHVSHGLDGGWSVWLPWGPCTATLLADVRSRDRQCDNPSPSALGKDCQGLQTERSRCPARTTTLPTLDGAWSTWSSWGTCSATCNGGLQSRNRACTNPAPSHMGRDCHGNDVVQQICNTHNCPETNGAWSNWAAWSSCSATCNGGLQSRTRACTRPTPSQFGRACTGNNVDNRLCNNNNCPEKAVAFSVHTPTGRRFTSPLFSHTLVNTGSYNQAKGIFTCPVAGIYSFSVTLYVDMSGTGDVFCIFLVNGANTAFVESYHEAHDTSSGTLVVPLNVGDAVYLSCGGWDHVHPNSYPTAFSGVLITAT